jgi:hypothetical protein
MIDSILDSIKEQLSVPLDNTAFDKQITLFINGVFSTLTQVGIGPTAGFRISNNTTTWDAFLGSSENLESVKSYMYLKVRLLWDTPQNSFGITAIEKLAEEELSRISYTREGEKWTTEHPPTSTSTSTQLDCW